MCIRDRVFAVVRDPWSRLWSAWQSKFLVRHTRYLRSFGDQPWFPRVPTSAEDVVEDYRRFVMARPWETDPELRKDVHFVPQVRSVDPSRFPSARIYDLSELSALFADIHDHLGAADRELYLPRANETPLGMTSEVLDSGVLEAVRDAYAADFEAFDDRWDPERLKLVPSGWSQDAIEHVAFHTVANERIGDLSSQLRSTQRELRSTRRELRQLQATRAPGQRASAELQRLRSVPLAELPGRVARKAGRTSAGRRVRQLLRPPSSTV